MAKYSEQTWLLFAVSGVALCVECEQKLPCVHKPIAAILTSLCGVRCRKLEDALIKVRSHVSIQIDDAGFVKEMPDVLPETFRFLFFDAVQTVGLV